MFESNFKKKHSLLFKKYKVGNLIGEGSFGKVYLGKNIDNGESVAIKVEERRPGKSALEPEAFTLQALKGFGIPEIKSYGKYKHFRVLIENLLGKSLFDIYDIKKGKFSLEEVCLIAIQIIDRIEFVHSHGYIHRDIKPDNFLIGNPDKNIIYIIDFGMSKKYISSKSGKHIQFTDTGKLTGSLRFASINALKGGEQSRKDDLISIGYMLIFFMKGKLPWQSIIAKDFKEEYIKILRIKIKMKPELLCNSLPKQMEEYMKYVQNLGFKQEPNYNYMRDLFKSFLQERKKDINYLLFSWIKQEDIPFLKKYTNPKSRNDSPFKRIYKQIKDSMEKRSNSKNSSENYSFQEAEKVVESPNMKIVRSNSKDMLDTKMMSEYNTNIKKNTNTLLVNFEKTITSQLIKDLNKDGEQTENQATLNFKKDLFSFKDSSIDNYIDKEVEKKENKNNKIDFNKIKTKFDTDDKIGNLINNIKKNKETFKENIKNKIKPNKSNNNLINEEEKNLKSARPNRERKQNINIDKEQKDINLTNIKRIEKRIVPHQKSYKKLNINNNLNLINMNQKMIKNIIKAKSKETKEKNSSKNNYIENNPKNQNKTNQIIKILYKNQNNNFNIFQNTNIDNRYHAEDYFLKRNNIQYFDKANINNKNILNGNININKSKKKLSNTPINKNDFISKNKNEIMSGKRNKMINNGFNQNKMKIPFNQINTEENKNENNYMNINPAFKNINNNFENNYREPEYTRLDEDRKMNIIQTEPCNKYNNNNKFQIFLKNKNNIPHLINFDNKINNNINIRKEKQILNQNNKKKTMKNSLSFYLPKSKNLNNINNFGMMKNVNMNNNINNYNAFPNKINMNINQASNNHKKVLTKQNICNNYPNVNNNNKIGYFQCVPMDSERYIDSKKIPHHFNNVRNRQLKKYNDHNNTLPLDSNINLEDYDF